MPPSKQATVEAASAPAISEGTPGQYQSSVPAVRVEFGAGTHTGKVRENNEDHFAVVRRTRSREVLLTNVPDVAFPDDHAHTLVVADGVGGRGFGELASEFVLRIGWELAGQATSWLMKFEETNWQEIRARVEAYVGRIHAAMQEHARNNPQLAGMGTTWTCLYVMGRDAVLAHVGDSRAYLFRQGTLRQLTHDHTFAQALIDRGVPSEETAPFKHILTNSLAARTEAVHPEIDHVPLCDGDRLLLCTDGLTDLVSDDDIAATLRSVVEPQGACDALIHLALQHGGKDNVTVVLADFHVPE
jgi:protein phosphatase